MTEAQDTAHTSDAIGLLSKVRLMDTACIQKDPLLGVRADGWLNRGISTNKITWGFLKMEDPQATMGFYTKIV